MIEVFKEKKPRNMNNKMRTNLQNFQQRRSMKLQLEQQALVLSKVTTLSEQKLRLLKEVPETFL